MATERLKERLSAVPTLFPTTVERLRQLCRVCSRFRLCNFQEIVCWLNQLRTFTFGAPFRTPGLTFAMSTVGEPEEMLKITITNTAKEERWILQGRLVAPWVEELKANWNKMRRVAERGKCIVNLDEVTFIDRSGERMLRCMSRQGAQLVASDVYVKHVLRRLRGKSN